MEKSYPESTDVCKLVKARAETVRLLLDYSRSLEIIRHKGLVFENNIN